MSKRFLFPVLAIAAFGLPAWGDVVEYCAGTGCGANNQTAFNNAVATDDYTYDGLTTFSAMSPAFTYTDSTSGIVFGDFPGTGTHMLSVSSGSLTTPGANDDSIVLVIPSTVLAVYLTVTIPMGLCANDCPENQSSGFVGFINTGSPTSPWSVSISPLGSTSYVEINNFNAAIAGSDDMGGGSSTPEIGTLLLIGAGLISMRWMRRWPRRVLRTLQPA